MPDQILVSADRIWLDQDWIVRSVQGSYWGAYLSRDKILAALANSVAYGAYLPNPAAKLPVPGRQVGFVRCVTDSAIFSSITDVLVEESFRGQGIGSWLMDEVIRDPRIANTICILQARPGAQLWYRHWDFVLVDARSGIMQRMPK